MTLLVSCESISKSYGSITLFKEISFGIFKGDKMGIIGPNGSGKSTLLKIIAGIETPDAGNVAGRKAIRIGYVPQTSIYPDLPIQDILLKALGELGDSHENALQVNILLSQLGFADPEQHASTLSGGWKKRLDIAAVLIRSPDLILFDEPTNHLDLDSILWFEEFLQRASFSYAIISHDRYFLENVTNRMCELNRRYPKGLFIADGSYNLFLEKREQFLQGQVEQQKSLASKVRGEVEWLKQNPKARTTKAQSRVQQAERLIKELAELKIRNKQRRSEIDFSSTDRLANKLLAGKNLTKSLGEKRLFAGVDLTLSPGMRLGIVGANGTGKTTLLKILSGELKPDLGTIKCADGLRIVYFDQHRSKLPENLSLRRALSPDNDMVSYRGQSIHVNSWCKRFLFNPDRLDLPVSQLSGGEKARVLIARLMVQPADILLLDEPTNDLDISTLEVLEESLLEFPGAIVLITHDRYMLDNVCNVIIGLGSRGDQYLFADYIQWEAYLAENNAETDLKLSAKASSETKSAAGRSSSRKLSYKEKLELEQMDEKVAKLEEEIAGLQKLIDDPQYATDAAKLQETCQLLHMAQTQLDQCYARWQELENKQSL